MNGITLTASIEKKIGEMVKQKKETFGYHPVYKVYVFIKKNYFHVFINDVHNN